MTPPQKERIIDQAMHMFVSQGIKSVRMDDIAQQLGVSKRTLYEMFGDKEGLLLTASGGTNSRPMRTTFSKPCSWCWAK